MTAPDAYWCPTCQIHRTTLPTRLRIRHTAHPYYRWAWTVTQGGVRRASGDAPTWAAALAVGLAEMERQTIEVLR